MSSTEGRGKFFAEFLYNSGIDARMIYLRENSIVLTLKTFQIVHASSLTCDGFLKFAFECDDC